MKRILGCFLAMRRSIVPVARFPIPVACFLIPVAKIGLTIGVLALTACTTAIRYQPSAGLAAPGKTALRVGVYDFSDLTKGENALDWDAGGGWAYGNLSAVCADAAADVLRSSGHFQSVERISGRYGNTAPPKTCDVVVAGEIKEFKTGSYPHPTVFINPLCALFFVGIPTVYGKEHGNAELHIVLLDGQREARLQDFAFRSSCDPKTCWWSILTGWSSRQRRGRDMLAAISDTFGVQLGQSLRGELGQTLLAMDSDPARRASATARPIPPAAPGQPVVASAVALPPLPALRSSDRSAIVIGLSKYQRAGEGGLTNLAFAASDAVHFRDALIRQGWNPDRVKCLTDAAATKTEIEKWVRYGPDLDNALFVVYWAGHGYPDPLDARKLFLACYDTDVANPASGLRMSDLRTWLEERKARNAVLIADACHAGGLIAGRSASDTSARGLAVRMRPESVPPGWVYLLGARTGDKAAEHPSLQGGLYTSCLIEALGGAADGCGIVGKKDGVVTLGEIREYVREKVQEKAFQLNLSGAFETQDYANTGDNAIWDLTLRAK